MLGLMAGQIAVPNVGEDLNRFKAICEGASLTQEEKDNLGSLVEKMGVSKEQAKAIFGKFGVEV